MYMAMLGDLVGSRRVKDRAAFNSLLQTVLSGVASEYADQWLAPLTPTKGLDEISGVLVGAERAFDIIVAINEVIWPQHFRFALATGGIDIAVDSGNAALMDGEVFHHAATALARAREQRLPLGLHFTDVDNRITALIEQLASLRHCIVADWTKAQAGTVRLYRTGVNQAQVAAQLGVTQQTVNGHLRKARWREVTAAERAIRLYFASLPMRAEP